MSAESILRRAKECRLEVDREGFPCIVVGPTDGIWGFLADAIPPGHFGKDDLARACYPEAERGGLPTKPTFLHEGLAVWLSSDEEVGVIVAPCMPCDCSNCRFMDNWPGSKVQATDPLDERWLQGAVKRARRRART